METPYFDVKTRWKDETTKFADTRRFENIRARLALSPYDLVRPQLLPEDFFQRLEYILEHISLEAKRIGEVQTSPLNYIQTLDALVSNRLKRHLRRQLYNSAKCSLAEFSDYYNVEDYTTVASSLIAAVYTIIKRDPPSALDGVPNVNWFF